MCVPFQAGLLSAPAALFGWTQKGLEGSSDSSLLFAQLIIWGSQKGDKNNDSPAVAAGLAQFGVFGPGVRTQGRGAICFGLKLNLPRDTDRCSDPSAGRLLFQCRVKFPPWACRATHQKHAFPCSNCLLRKKEISRYSRHTAASQAQYFTRQGLIEMEQ